MKFIRMMDPRYVAPVKEQEVEVENVGRRVLSTLRRWKVLS